MQQNGEFLGTADSSHAIQSETITGEACANCTYARLMPADVKVMKCHRKPPFVFMVPTTQGVQFLSDQPTTRRDSWCGEYERRSGMKAPK